MQPTKIYCVNDRTPLHSWKVMLLNRGTLYTSTQANEETGEILIEDLGEAASQWYKTERFCLPANLPTWAQGRIRELREEMKFISDLLTSAGHVVPLLDSGHYPEGFRWDVDNYPARQTRRWNSETKELEPGHDGVAFDPL